MAVRSSTDDVVRYACDRFGEDRHTVVAALTEAHRTGVYPAEIKISRPAWMKLAETAYCAVEHRYDDAARDKALNFYHLVVEPHERWAAQAIKVTEGLPEPDSVALPIKSASWTRAAPIVAGRAPDSVCCSDLRRVHLCDISHVALVHLRQFGECRDPRGSGCSLRRAGDPWALGGAAYWIPLAGTFLAIIALGDLDAAKAFCKQFLSLDLDGVLSKSALLAAIAATCVAELRHGRFRREKKRH